MINSHTYIPKTILKAFSTQTNKVWSTFFIKLPVMKIKERNIERIGTLKNGYASDTEIIFNQKYESGIAALNKAVTKALRNKKENAFNNSDFDVDVIKNYFVFQMLRDEAAIRSLYPNLGAKKIQQLKNELVKKEASDSIIKETFNNHKLIICINPNGNLIGCNFPITITARSNHETLAMPISPYVLLILTNDFRTITPLRYVSKAHCEIDLNEAKLLNKQIVIVGKKKGLGYIFSKTYSVLEEALN